jgi:hypothetical protein
MRKLGNALPEETLVELEKLNPIAGATVLTDCQSTTGWSLGGLAINTTPSFYQVLSVDAPGTRIPGNAVHLTAANNFDVYGGFQFASAQVIPNGRIQALIHVGPFEDSGTNSVQHIALRVRVYAASVTSGAPANFFTCTVTAAAGWQLVTLGGLDDPDVSGYNGATGLNNVDNGWVKTGTIDWDTAMTAIDFYWAGDGSVQPDIMIRQVRYGGTTKGVVTIDVDDQDISVYTQLFPLLKQNRLVCTNFVITAYVGAGGYMNQAQLQEMYDYGCDNSLHSDSHGIVDRGYGTGASYLRNLITNLATTTTAVQAEYSPSLAYHIARGWTRNNCHRRAASPFGNHMSEEVYQAHIDAFTNLGIISARSTHEAIQGVGYCDQWNAATVWMTNGNATGVAHSTAKYPGKLIALMWKAAETGGRVNFLAHKFVTTTPITNIILSTEYAVSHAAIVLAEIRRMIDAGLIWHGTSGQYQEILEGKPIIL